MLKILVDGARFEVPDQAAALRAAQRWLAKSLDPENTPEEAVWCAKVASAMAAAASA